MPLIPPPPPLLKTFRQTSSHARVLGLRKIQAVLQSRGPLEQKYLPVNSLLLIEACNPNVSGTASARRRAFPIDQCL